MGLFSRENPLFQQKSPYKWVPFWGLGVRTLFCLYSPRKKVRIPPNGYGYLQETPCTWVAVYDKSTPGNG